MKPRDPEMPYPFPRPSPYEENEMEDKDIIELYILRDERAVKESGKKYGRLCQGVAMRILGNREDARETENDTYLRAWNTIPPTEPKSLGAYLAAICRRLSIDRLRSEKRKKRGAGEYTASLDELDAAVSDLPDPADAAALKDALKRFLAALPEESRDIFLKRYWWFLSVKEIARRYDMSESAVKMQLARMRNKLRDDLKGEM